MKKNLPSLSFLMLLIFSGSHLLAQRGYYDAPYKRYEADMGLLTNGAVVTSKSYAQTDIQSEASEQVCVEMNSLTASVEWTLTEAADGFVVRYSVPDGESAVIGIYDGNTRLAGLTLTSNWSWEYLWNDPNGGGITNHNPRMKFDEARCILSHKIAANGKLRIEKESGNLYIDFVELEPVPEALPALDGSAVYSGDGSTLQNFINSNGGKTIFLPSGNYNVNRELYFGVKNTALQGAGMWYTHINFTSTIQYNGGLHANANDISFSDLYLTTDRSSRSGSYKSINGVYTSGSVIRNVWAEHFECGAWIAQYNSGGPAKADGFTLTNCRFRDNYADGINLCKGTSNAIVEHCNFRNNGDDDQAIWCADGLECINNTFRFNTSENNWRSAGLAIYGGKDNKAHNLIIKDNLEVGIRVNNEFQGVGFNNSGMHQMNDITIISCGTFNDLFNTPVGAIDIICTSNNGTQVRNIRFSNIDITDSKNDAINISKYSGDGIYNLTFENCTINGTGKEYPNNNVYGLNQGRGYFVLFNGYPNGDGTFCGMNYLSRGGNAGVDINTENKGSFAWSQSSDCLTPFINISAQTLAVASAANSTVDFDINSNTSWNISSDQDWLVPNIISDTGGSTITLTADQTSESRTANVTVSSEVLTTQTIIVTQNAGLTGLEEVTGNPDLIFPNPTNGIVKITCKEASDLSVYDLQGQLLVSKKLKIIDNMIDINQLPTGIYVLKIISGNKVLSAKIIKE